jgi:hypothetical protein
MPLDHYVSQVHLRKFYSPALDGLMYAIRKSDLKCFRTKSQDVCRIEDGSTNAFLRKERAIEEFLKDVEPRYDASLAKLREKKFDQECIHCIAGFVAYVVTCSPTAMRINSAPVKAVVKSAATILDAQGGLPKAPKMLAEKTVTELLSDGTLKFDVDPKYPQAIGVASIKHQVSVFGNSPWEILHSDATCPFLTSDFPAAIEVADLKTPISRIVPLAPDLAIRIRPDIRLRGMNPDLTFAKFETTSRKLTRPETHNLNRLFVRCAEDQIFYRDDHPWTRTFVAKNRRYRIEPVTLEVPKGSGNLIVSTQHIRESPLIEPA